MFVCHSFIWGKLQTSLLQSTELHGEGHEAPEHLVPALKGWPLFMSFQNDPSSPAATYNPIGKLQKGLPPLEISTEL